MKVNKMKKIMPAGSHNPEKYKISEKYSVVFYTISRYIVFQYCWDDGIDFYKTSRSNVLWWISPQEKEKLLTFEDRKSTRLNSSH